MKRKLIEFVKNHHGAYLLYYFFMNFIIAVLKCFVRPQDNLILFITAGGKRYVDSPRIMYEAMLEDERFQNYELVWAFRNPNEISIQGRARVIKTDSLQYYLTALKARCWITNVSVERGLQFKGKNTFYFCTWHGTPIKKIGFDINNKKTFSKSGKIQYDVICGQGEYDRTVYHSAFGISDDKILLSGLPRNDCLTTATRKHYLEIRKQFNIPEFGKVILYAPTFHDTVTASRAVFAPPVNLKHWMDELGESYYIFFRAHASVFKIIGIETDSQHIIDVSDYPDINDLYMASDLLVSDYSSIFFDYSILAKPMFCFAYDYSEYVASRGLYMNICEEISGGEIDEDMLLQLIREMDYERESQKAACFCKKYVTSVGNATQKAIECVYQHIVKNNEEVRD